MILLDSLLEAWGGKQEKTLCFPVQAQHAAVPSITRDPELLSNSMPVNHPKILSTTKKYLHKDLVCVGSSRWSCVIGTAIVHRFERGHTAAHGPCSR